MWRGVPFARQRRPIVGVLRMCWLLPGLFDCFCSPPPPPPESPPSPPPLRDNRTPSSGPGDTLGKCWTPSPGAWVSGPFPSWAQNASKGTRTGGPGTWGTALSASSKPPQSTHAQRPLPCTIPCHRSVALASRVGLINPMALAARTLSRRVAGPCRARAKEKRGLRTQTHGPLHGILWNGDVAGAQAKFGDVRHTKRTRSLFFGLRSE